MEPVYLRSLEIGDLDRTYRWHNNHELYKTMGVFHYVSRATEEDWLQKKQAFSNDEVNLAICLTNNSQHIGNIYLRNIDWIARNAELRIFIGEPDQRSQGYGQAAVRMLVKHAFEDLGLVRLYLTVIDGNEAGRRAYEKCGFVAEGKFRKHFFNEGRLKDCWVMGLCADDLPVKGL
jgi:diamine N-acetyltransferase